MGVADRNTFLFAGRIIALCRHVQSFRHVSDGSNQWWPHCRTTGGASVRLSLGATGYLSVDGNTCRRLHLNLPACSRQLRSIALDWMGCRNDLDCHGNGAIIRIDWQRHETGDPFRLGVELDSIDRGVPQKVRVRTSLAFVFPVGILQHFLAMWLVIHFCFSLRSSSFTDDDCCHDGRLLGGDFAAVDRRCLELEYGGTSMAFSDSAPGCDMHCRLWFIHVDAPKPGRSKLHHSDTQQALDPADSRCDECGASVLRGNPRTSCADAECTKCCTCCDWGWCWCCDWC